ncbi:TPA: acyltransferase family protein [Streptococcus pneumoniae]|nr:acyltransferase family protein [Streptococcus pneumoniae]
MTKVRINWVDFGKGFAIFLVLVGHVFIGLSESNKFSIANDVLLFLIAQIYIFHIPVFFALSGYFFRPVSDLKEFWYYAKKKTIILGIPYIFYSIIHFCLQKLAGASVRVPTTIHNLLNIYRYPLGVSWYLYTLWSILIVYGLLSIVFKNRKSLFLVSVFAYIFTLFIQIDIFIVQRTLVWGIAFIVCVLVAFAIFPKMEKNFPKTFLYFTKYGKDSLGIYILHAPICSMIRILMLKVGINSVFLHVVVGIVLGWYLSILATYILKKIPFLNIVLLPQKYIKLK